MQILDLDRRVKHVANKLPLTPARHPRALHDLHDCVAGAAVFTISVAAMAAMIAPVWRV